MARLISSSEVARQLGVSTNDVNRLVKQEILHPSEQTPAGYLFAGEEIERIASSQEPTIFEEAAQVGVQIQQEVIYSVSAMKQLWRRLAVLGSLSAAFLILAIVLMAALFRLYPDRLSSFFGYYYQYNYGQLTSYKDTSSHVKVLGASTQNPDLANTDISLIASLTKPIAAASLLIIKATDGQQYSQIVQKPSTATAVPGPAGPIGNSGKAGADGKNGANGLIVESGANVILNTRNDVRSDIITSALPPQIADDSIPISALIAGDYSTKLTTGSYAFDISGNSSSATTAAQINGNALGVTTPVSGHLLIGDGLAWQSQALGGNATIDSNGVLAVTGLTVASFSSPNITQFNNDAGYSSATTSETFSNKIISGLANSLVNISNASLNNSSFSINTSGILSGGGVVSLGDTLNISGAEVDTLNSVAARGASTSTALTLSSISNDITAGTLHLGGDALTDLSGSGLSVSGGILNISGLTNYNFSGAAGISNSNLAHSSFDINGNTGSGSVSLGGGLSIFGSGITDITAAGSGLTVSTQEADTLASVTARGATTSANVTFSGGLVFSGPVTLSSLINCSSLATDSTGIIKCGNAVTSNSAVAFTDSSPATLSDSNLTELFNDSSKPNITPGSNSQNVLVSTHMRFSGGGNRDTDAAIRVVRNIGSSANCSSGVQVGDSFSTFLTKNNFNHDANGTFLDTPNTTSPVYYTVCSSSNSQFGSTPVSERIDVTLMRIGQ